MSYTPPDLVLDVVLSQQTSVPPDLSLDVVLCEPQSTENDAFITINASINVDASADLTVGNAPSV
ncbi:hypothetical protein, partial [Psychrobacter sp. 1Y4]|uniref:hypothetical protein n=1 Tax=Psychrobacter sp. 1Y4 TaxID=3453575 RepID=UPI003F48C969